MAWVPKPGAPMPPPNCFGLVQTTTSAYASTMYFFGTREQLEQRLKDARDYHNRNRLPPQMSLQVKRDIRILTDILHPGGAQLWGPNTAGEQGVLDAERAAQQAAADRAAAGLDARLLPPPFGGPAILAEDLGAETDTIKMLTKLGSAVFDAAAAAGTMISRRPASNSAAPPDLPTRTPRGKTSGVMRSSDGEVKLQSGRAGPAQSMPKGSSGFDVVTKTHVEGHAAALMQQQGLREATLYINNPTICSSCAKLLPSMLPANSTLHVVLPDGSIANFVGVGP